MPPTTMNGKTLRQMTRQRASALLRAGAAESVETASWVVMANLPAPLRVRRDQSARDYRCALRRHKGGASFSLILRSIAKAMRLEGWAANTE
jgi:hypothetical protein